MLINLKAALRILKSELGLRPVYHHKNCAPTARLLITVIAYQFVELIQRLLQSHGIRSRWSSLWGILSVQRYHIPLCQRLEDPVCPQNHPSRTSLATIYRVLNIDLLPGGVQKLRCDLRILLNGEIVVSYVVF